MPARWRDHVLLRYRAAALLATLAALPVAAAVAWNDSAIRWHAFESGMALAREQGRPALVVFYADWCSTCHALARLFDDPAVVEAAGEVVMIRIDRDARGELDTRFAPDGRYLPRLIPLSPSGEVLAAHAPRDAAAFRYFVRPSERQRLLALLAGLARSRAEASPPSPPDAGPS